MENWKANLYRLALQALPQTHDDKPRVTGDMPYEKDFARILRAQRVIGATVALFDANGMTGALSLGYAGRGREETQAGTVYRIASVTKHITALAAFRLHEAGKIDLDADVDPFLSCSLRHPKAPDTPVTLRRLITHTAGIRDGQTYTQNLLRGKPLSEIMQEDSFTDAPGGFEYSNLGAGIVACVLESMLQKDFESIMQEALFAPLRATATFYPQLVRGALADAWRILPPAKAAGYNAAARRAANLPAQQADPEHHYTLSQGNLCIAAPDLCRIGAALMQPRYAAMRKPYASFGARAHNLTEGLGTFIVNDSTICPQTLYGHQGLAYGAVHGLFYDPDQQRGVVILTSGCSEARNGVLADINKAIMKRVFA